MSNFSKNEDSTEQTLRVENDSDKITFDENSAALDAPQETQNDLNEFLQEASNNPNQSSAENYKPAVPLVTSFTAPECSKASHYLMNSDESRNTEEHSELKSDPLLNETTNNQTHRKHSLIPELSSSFRINKTNFLSRTNTPSLTKSKLSPTEIKQRGTNDRGTQSERQHHLRFDADFQMGKSPKRRIEISTTILKLKHYANSLSEYRDLRSQMNTIENIYRCILDLKRIARELKDSEVTNEKQASGVDLDQKYKTKDNNKIYIKFLATKAGNKKKSCNIEVQTEFSLDRIFSYSSILKDEKYFENIDSMDGMFIPSTEAPSGMEDDEDEDGLDITITFPEFQNAMHEVNSHLSVCFSDISAEALGRLKRCPKEFTLRMDFVQGKMFFQSERTTVNNFCIGPNLKFTDCVIDNKKSDIISIKPSTECIYTSQIITVEGSKQKSSIKTLRSTDSELFNVASLPFINKKTSEATKSCITFKNDGWFSSRCVSLNRRYFNSMPQIPSFSKILEEPALESANANRAGQLNDTRRS